MILRVNEKYRFGIQSGENYDVVPGIYRGIKTIANKKFIEYVSVYDMQEALLNPDSIWSIRRMSEKLGDNDDFEKVLITNERR